MSLVKDIFLTHKVLLIILLQSLLISMVASGQKVKDTIVVNRASNSKYSLSGKITDAATGLPLPGASVYFTDLKTGSASNKEGHFTINSIPYGNQLVSISYIGYSTLVQSISITGNIVNDFSLSPSTTIHSEVIVTGFSNGAQIKNTAIPLSVVKREDLYKSAAANIIDALSKQPGITQLTTGPAISKPYIRGLGYNRVLTISNGIRQEGQQWGDEHGIEIDDYNVDKIEILKGPASLMYGSDGLAGVINIISNTPVLQNTIKGNINTNYQTNNGLYAFNANLAGNLNGFNWNVYGTQKAAHDYSNKYDGYVFNSKFKNTDFGGYIGLNKSWGYSHLTYSNFGQQLGLIEGERDDSNGKFIKITGVDNNGNDITETATDDDFTSYNPFIGKQRINHQKLVLDNAFYISGKGHFTVTTGWQLNDRKEFSSISEPELAGLHFNLQSFTYDIKYFLPTVNNWQTSFGIGGMQQQNKNLGSEVLIPEYKLFDIGGFAYTRKTFKKATLSGGLRYDNRNIRSEFFETAGITKFTAFNKKFGNLSASLGATIDLNKKVTAKFNISRGFRAPNLAELGANGVHEGTIKYEYGNNDLKSETSLQADAGIDINTEHLSFSGSLFYNKLDNFIFSSKLSAVGGGDSIPATDNDNNYAAFRYLQSNAYLYGAEFMIDIHPHPFDWLHFQNTISLVRGKSGLRTDSTENLPNIPAARWIAELRGDFKNTGNLFSNVYAKLETDVTFAQNMAYTAYQTETATPGYALLNAGFGGSFLSHKKEVIFSLFFSANNITNVAYQNHLSRLKYTPENMATGRFGVFNMGSNYSLKVNIPLNLKG